MEKLKELIQKAKTVSLDPVAKAQVREHVASYMALKPLRVPTNYQLPTVSWFAVLRFKTVPIALVVVLFSGIGTSFAAERALPGDMLYGVKVGVNERVRMALAFSDEAKANVAARLAERRAEEGHKLAVRGRFNEKARVVLEKNFEKQADRVQERLKKLEKKNPHAAAKVRARFEEIRKKTKKLPR